MSEAASRRVAYLDGVRGVAAQIVVIHHFILGFGTHHRTLDAIFNGYTAVLIFFVLSGLVMSASSAKADTPLPLRCFTRYLRLALPMLPVALVGWVLLGIFPTASSDLAQLTLSAWSARTYNVGLPPAWQVLTDAIIQPFMSGSIYLNTSTGTMGPELAGSILVFVLIRYCRQRWRPLVLSAVCLIGLGLRGSWSFQGDALFCFASGSLLWHYRGVIPRLPTGISHLAVAISVPILVLTGYGVSVPLGFVYSIEPNNILKLFVVVALIGGIIASRQLQALFGGPLPVFLGRISFGVYLIHQPLESTIFARLYALWRPHRVGLAALLIAFTVVSAIAGWAVTLLADEPIVRALKELTGRYSGAAKLRFAQQSLRLAD